jgi:hypothetical protein
MKLSEAQVSEFRREGCLYPQRALDARDATQRAIALQAFAEARGQPLTSLLRFKAHLRFRALEQIARNPAILDAVESLIGPDILVFTSTVWAKAPHDRRYVSWHQDSAYFGLDPHAEITAWVALTDSRSDNGCLRVIPPHVRSTLGRRSALLVRGEDRHGHWDTDPAPVGDDDPAIAEFMQSAFRRYRDQEASADPAGPGDAR